MRSIITFVSATLIFASPLAQAQDLLPATSEDVYEFDRQISESQSSLAESSEPNPTSKKSKKANFGQQVAEEAKRLKNSDEKRDFGHSISAERRKDSERRSEPSHPTGRNAERRDNRNDGGDSDSTGRGRKDHLRSKE